MVKTGARASITLDGMAKRKAVPSPMAQALLLARRRVGLGQQQVAEQIGVDYKTISRLESGQSRPTLKTLEALATIYGSTLDELAGRSVLRIVKRPPRSFIGGSEEPVESMPPDAYPKSIEDRLRLLEEDAEDAKRVGAKVLRLHEALNALASSEALPRTLRDRLRGLIEPSQEDQS